jgi:hypothetical protein
MTFERAVLMGIAAGMVEGVRIRDIRTSFLPREWGLRDLWWVGKPTLQAIDSSPMPPGLAVPRAKAGKEIPIIG